MTPARAAHGSNQGEGAQKKNVLGKSNAFDAHLASFLN